MSTTIDGIRIQDMPALGAVTDGSSVVGEHAGSGLFTAPALAQYVAVKNASTYAVNVMAFGAVGDGVTDDAPAIQAAINSLPAAGGVVQFPPLQFAIKSTIILGNGTGAGGANSTRNGIILRGTGGIQSPFLLTSIANVGTRILWAGAAGGSTVMVGVNGPCEGIGVQNIFLQGANNVSNGLYLTSGCFGDFSNLSIQGCQVTHLRLSNCQNNRFHNIFINMPVFAATSGIYLDGSGPANTCFNDFENLCIGLPASGSGYGIYLKVADSNSFRGVYLLGGTSAAVSVQFDYTAPSYGWFPCANAFYGIDPFGAGSTTHPQQWVNSGTPSDIGAPNFIRGLFQGNGALQPNLANLLPDLPASVASFQLLNQTAAVASTTFYNPVRDGMYSVDYLLLVTAAATAGTIQPDFGAILGSASYGTQGATAGATTVGASSSGRFTMQVTGGHGMTFQTVFAGVTGTPTYSVYLNVTRLR
jgi:hypothetical protein